MPWIYVSWQLQTHNGVSMNYKISWNQSYPEWEQMVDAYMDMILEASELKEAIDVIAYIKSL